MSAMPAQMPEITWNRFFARLTQAGQRSLERALADGGLLLGEYMELVERAYLQAYLMRKRDAPARPDLIMAYAQDMAEKLVRSYAARKREWVLRNTAYRTAAWQATAYPPEAMEGMTAGILPLPDILSAYRKLRLRRRIHASIESMKHESI